MNSQQFIEYNPLAFALRYGLPPWLIFAVIVIVVAIFATLNHRLLRAARNRNPAAYRQLTNPRALLAILVIAAVVIIFGMLMNPRVQNQPPAISNPATRP